MKKLVFVFAVVASASLFSCGNADKAEAPATDSVAVEEVAVAEVDSVVEAPADSVAADSTVVAE